MVLLPNDEEVANSFKKIPNSRLECTNHTLFQTKTAEKNTPFGAAHTYTAYIRDYPPPPSGAKDALQIMSLPAYASETNKYDPKKSETIPSIVLWMSRSYNKLFQQ